MADCQIGISPRWGCPATASLIRNKSGLNAVGAPPFVNDITMGAVLLTVAVLDGPYLARRLISARRALGA